MTWLALAALGAGHGINPAMGWLFAVALGLQDGRTRAVWRALPPLALGHALAIGAAALVAAALGTMLPPDVLTGVVGVSLLLLGVRRLVRHHHPRVGGMVVGFRDLATWSFLMATAHGAGLMVLPLYPGHHAHSPAHSGLWVTVAHTAGYLLVTGVVAVVVHRKLGLRMLRKAWLNLDLLWGAALVATGLLTIVL